MIHNVLAAGKTISTRLTFRKTDFFLEHWCQPTISIYYKELNFKVNVELTYKFKVIDLTFFGTGLSPLGYPSLA